MSDKREPRVYIIPASWQVSGDKYFDHTASIRVVEESEYQALEEKLRIAEHNTAILISLKNSLIDDLKIAVETLKFYATPGIHERWRAEEALQKIEEMK